MKIGIISDTHDDVRALDQALSILEAEGIATLFHCGDLCSPQTLEALSDFDVWVARGNMDRHPELEASARKIIGNGRLAERHWLTLAGRSVLLLHGHRREELRRLISSGVHAYVIHGHTHRRRNETVGPTRVINPGALGGVRWQQRSFCILDLVTDHIEFIKM